MKEFLSVFLKNMISSLVIMMGIVGFFITACYPKISEQSINIPISTIVCFSIFLVSIIWAVYKSRYMSCRNNLTYIEMGKTEQDNDIFWFSSNYFFNVGDIIKLLECRDNGTTTSICTAKIQSINQNGHVALLPLANYKTLEIFRNKDQANKTRFKSIHINIDDITVVMKQAQQDCTKTNIL